MDYPRYTALSYTWGEPTPTRSVAVDGADLEVRQNLFDFLHAYTTERWGMHGVKKPGLFWIDQICINQGDLHERSDQVRIMDKIYKQAKMVLIWLGCEPEMIEAACRLQNTENDSMCASVTLLAHPYFSRIWVVQEIALSVNSPLIVCGGSELYWNFIRSSNVSTQQIAVVSMVSARRGHTGKMRTLESCVRYHCKNNCHDPRDKVYGLLGLTSERWRVRVDYAKDVLEVYFDVVAALFEELFDLADPECLYPERLTVMATPHGYRYTLVVLARSMGVPRRQLNGLESFLEYIQCAYLSTKMRDIQYTYTGRIYTRVQADFSSEQILAPEEEIEVRWGSITATRRNPSMRDIISEMGLQLASVTAEGIAGQGGDSTRAVDRWWCKHDGEIRYFECPDEDPISPYP